MKLSPIVMGAVMLSAAASLIWWRPEIVVEPVVQAYSQFAVQAFMNRREKVANDKQEISKQNLEGEVVRVELSGQRFDVPMRYFYSDAYVKRGYWPSAKI